jgi:hypothetical protein
VERLASDEGLIGGHMVRLIAVLGCVLVLGLLGAGPAEAAIFTLNNWNVTELDVSDDFVEVRTGTSDCGGLGLPSGTNLCFRWFEGPTVEGPGALGIDQFFYDSSSLPTLAPAEWTPPPPSEGCASGSHTADGFTGTFETRCQSPGGTTGISSWVGFTLPSLTGLDSAEDFAAHVRYANNCSGFVSGRTVKEGSGGSDANCGGAVPEPGSLAVLGGTLVGLAVIGRRWLGRR